MIEIKDVSSFSLLRNTIPYFIFFYKKEGEEIKDHSNLVLIKYIRSIEMLYRDLPVIGFDYLKFIKSYSNHNLKSCNDIIVVHKPNPIKTYEKPSQSKIIEILNKIREERILFHQKSSSKTEYSTTKPWYVHQNNREISCIALSDPDRISNQNKIMGFKEGNHVLTKTLQNRKNSDNTDISLISEEELIKLNNVNHINKFQNPAKKLKTNPQLISNNYINVKHDDLITINTKEYFNFPSATDSCYKNFCKNDSLNNEKFESKEKSKKSLYSNSFLTPSSLLEFPQTKSDIKYSTQICNYSNLTLTDVKKMISPTVNSSIKNSKVISYTLQKHKIFPNSDSQKFKRFKLIILTKTNKSDLTKSKLG